MEIPQIVVKLAYDDEAAVWFVQESNLPGLAAEASTLDELVSRIPGLIMDLIEENGFDLGNEASDVPVEIIATRLARVPLHDAA